jgi:predicted regulator of Ras-like GTPase activity (Roadblock/LC7/MglB family)
MTPATTGADVRASLGTLKDIAGITGSFVFTHGGQLVARELPTLFDDTALAEASGRLTRLRDTFAALGDALEVAVVRFRDHKLYVKSFGAGMLCIVADGAVNMPALRMAANLVSRRIAPALEGSGLEPLVLDAPAPPLGAPAPARGPVAQAPPGMRRFRGRPVE